MPLLPMYSSSHCPLLRSLGGARAAGRPSPLTREGEFELERRGRANEASGSDGRGERIRRGDGEGSRDDGYDRLTEPHASSIAPLHSPPNPPSAARRPAT